MDLTRLRHILSVARNRSFSRAAEEEGITQPALSRSIAAFEKRHGVVLFDRGRGGAHPTPAGHLVIEQARRLLEASTDLERSLRLYGTGEAGRIAFGLGPMLASVILPDLSRVLLQTRPGLQILTMLRTPEQLLPELLSDRIEMIVGNSWQVSHVPGTEKQDIGRLRLSVLVRASHPLAGKTDIAISDLASFPAASPIEPSALDIGIRAGSFICDNFHILRDTVLQTDCVWVCSPTFVARELRDRALVELQVRGWGPLDSEICVVARRGRTQSPAARLVVDEIRSMLGPTGD